MYPKHMFYEEIKIKKKVFFLTYHSTAFKDSLQQQIHFKGNILGNKWYHCNERTLYHGNKQTKFTYCLIVLMLSQVRCPFPSFVVLQIRVWRPVQRDLH